MRSRLIGLLLVGAIAVLPVVTATAAFATSVDPDILILATEAGGEAPGLEPAGPDDESNEFRPEDYERPWTWWMGPLLLIGFGPILLGGAAFYYFKVHRPAQRSETSRR
ncbi:MAG: DUF4366 domain-containing protein [Actinobacteria bacterium]|nr:DUF4366 domain-containing protein [Actinomycetota bacterium]